MTQDLREDIRKLLKSRSVDLLLRSYDTMLNTLNHPDVYRESEIAYRRMLRDFEEALGHLSIMTEEILKKGRKS